MAFWALAGTLLLGPLQPSAGAASEVSAAAAGSACAYLAQQSDASSSDASSTGSAVGQAAFIASYPTAAIGPLHATAFLYDNAVAVLALLGCHQPQRARRIGDAILAALDRDRYWHDGRLRNGYLAGPVGAEAKLAGWWQSGQGRWLEDGYQAGSDNGNLAWAMLALLALDRATAGGHSDHAPQAGGARESSSPAAYRQGALRIASWVIRWRDVRGAGGFTGGAAGHEPAPSALRWKSTEHNIDLAVAFAALAHATGELRWQQASQAARHFVAAMWRSECGCFAVGTGEDGTTRNTLLALDAQVWPLLAWPSERRRYAAALSRVQSQLRRSGGFAYSEAGTSLWTEGSAQVLLLMELQARDADSAALRAAITAQRGADGGYFAAAAPQTPTGFMLSTDPSQPRQYFHIAHLGAAAWVALAEQRFNPFVPALPP